MKCSHIRIEICTFSINAKKNLEMGWYLLAMGRSHSSPFRTTISIYMMNVNIQFWSRWHCEWWCEWFPKKTLEHIWNIFASPRLSIYHLRDFAPILENDPHFRPGYHMKRTWADVISCLVILLCKSHCVAATSSLFSSLLFQSKT